MGFHQQIGFDLLGGGGRGALDDEAGGWSNGFWQHRAKADVDAISKEVCHACREDDAV